MKKVYNILIADDHQMFLDGLKLIFSDLPYLQIVAEAKTGTEVLAAMRDFEIDIAILDINMPEPNGFVVCTHIKQHYPTCKMIMLSMYSDENYITEFMRSGALAYVLKNSGKTELLNAIDSVLNNQSYISKNLRTADSTSDSFTKKLMLTKREIEIISLLVKEKSTAEIAEILFISTNTVNTHRKNILHKLGIKNATGLVKFAIDNQLT